MGYLDKTETTIDAVLTKLGRQYIASGKPFQITKFALGDDEIDYSLWDTTQNNPGVFIEQLPVFEAIIDENYAFKSKLLTLNPTVDVIPSIIANVSEIRIPISNTGAVSETIVTLTSNPTDSNTSYFVVLLDDTAGTLRMVSGRTDQFTFIPANTLSTNIVTTRIIVVGEETGARLEIPVTVTKEITTGTFIQSAPATL
jgi:hypothetical protein